MSICIYTLAKICTITNYTKSLKQQQQQHSKTEKEITFYQERLNTTYASK